MLFLKTLFVVTSLELGGHAESHPSLLKYAAFNLASALAGFGIVFGVAMIILSLI